MSAYVGSSKNLKDLKDQERGGLARTTNVVLPPCSEWVGRVGGDDGDLRPCHFIYIQTMGNSDHVTSYTCTASRVACMHTASRVACIYVYGIESSVRAARVTPLVPALQGYLAHEKTPTSLGPSQDPRHRPAVGS